MATMMINNDMLTTYCTFRYKLKIIIVVLFRKILDCKVFITSINLFIYRGFIARTNYVHFRQNSIIYLYNIADLLSYRTHINKYNCQI